MKKLNKKRKGFTIVELVIVIAVIAILAGVLIPTFAGVIEKANQSSDIQAVRQMNVILMAESVEEKPTNVGRVIEIISDGGYDTVGKRTPKSSGHGFYWHRDTNLIVLVKGTSELIYPEDNKTLNTLFENGVNVTEEEDFHSIGTNAGTNEEEEIEIPVDATHVDSLEKLEGALENSTYIVLDEVIDITRTLDIESDVTIYLNGRTLTVGASGCLSINFGNVTIIGAGTIKSNAVDPGTGIVVSAGCTLSLENTTFKSEGNYGIKNEGTINLKKSSFTNDGIYGIYNYSGGVLCLDESSFTNNGWYGIYNYGKLELTNNTSFIHEGYYGVYNNEGTVEEDTVNISGGNFTVNDGGYGILFNNGGYIEVYGTVFMETNSGNPVKYYNNAPIVNANDGTLKMFSVDISSSAFCTTTAGGKLTIDAKSSLNLTGYFKFPAPVPATDTEEKPYYAYNYDDNLGPTINAFKYDEKGDYVFHYQGSSRDLIESEEIITLENDTLWEENTKLIAGELLTINLNGNTLTLNDSDFSGGILNITNRDPKTGEKKTSGGIILEGNTLENCFNKELLAGLNIYDGIVISGSNYVYSSDFMDTISYMIEFGDGANNYKFVTTNNAPEFTIDKNKNEISVCLKNTFILKNTLTIPGGFNVTINLNGNEFSFQYTDINNTDENNEPIVKNNFISVPSNSTFKIEGGIEGGNMTTGEQKFFSGDSKGTITLENVKVPISVLLEITNNEKIIAINVDLDNSAKINEVTEVINGETKTKEIILTLKSGYVLPDGIIIPESSTMTININGNTLTRGNNSIIVGNECVLNVKGGTLTDANISNLAGGTVELSDLTIKHDFDFYTFLDSNIDNSSIILTDVKYQNLIFTKTNKVIDGQDKVNIDIKLADTTGIGRDWTIKANHVVNIYLNNRELKIDNNIHVYGTLNILRDEDVVGGGNISGVNKALIDNDVKMKKIYVHQGGNLSINANYFKDATGWLVKDSNDNYDGEASADEFERLYVGRERDNEGNIVGTVEVTYYLESTNESTNNN